MVEFTAVGRRSEVFSRHLDEFQWKPLCTERRERQRASGKTDISCWCSFCLLLSTATVSPSVSKCHKKVATEIQTETLSVFVSYRLGHGSCVAVISPLSYVVSCLGPTLWLPGWLRLQLDKRISAVDSVTLVRMPQIKRRLAGKHCAVISFKFAHEQHIHWTFNFKLIQCIKLNRNLNLSAELQ